MPDRSPRRNGNHFDRGDPAVQLGYQFNPEPEQIADPAREQEFAERLEDELRAVWSSPDESSFPPITPADLTAWHRHLLQGLEAEERVGHFRRYKEQSSYRILVGSDDDPNGEPQLCVCPGLEVSAPGSQTIWEAVKEACEAFQLAVAAYLRTGSPRDVREAVRPCAEFYTTLIKIRPFSVANDPLVNLALQAAYLRLGLEPLIYSPGLPTEPMQAPDADIERVEINTAFNRALARSLRPKVGEIDELVTFLTIHARFR